MAARPAPALTTLLTRRINFSRRVSERRDATRRWPFITAVWSRSRLGELRAEQMTEPLMSLDNVPSTKPQEDDRSHYSRRSFLTASASSAAVPLVAGTLTAETVNSQTLTHPTDLPSLTLKVNGRDHRLAIDVRTTLLDALREHLGLTGAKKGCDHGQCGACTVLLGGRRVLSCLTLAVAAQRHAVMTIEGLAAPDGALHPMQQAFIEHDAFQCGYCTPGQILSAIACVNEGHANEPNQIREYMSGNLCRCAAYPNIVDAVQQAKRVMKEA
jgi:xanthine dehydrogenase YagT iron-sulfur-binding subunit